MPSDENRTRNIAENLIGRVLGGDIPAAAGRPLASIGINFAALAVFLTFFGVWFIGEIGASNGQASVTYLAAGLAGMVGGYLGGRLTDRFGPRLVVLLGSTLQVAFVAILLLPGVGVVIGMISLIVVTFLQPLRGVAQRIALARVGPPEQAERRFAGYRLVSNLGGLGGPLLAAGLVAIGWWVVHLEVALLFAGSTLLAMRLPGPRAGEPAERPNPTVAARPGSLSVWRDSRMYGLLIATTAAWIINYSYETVMPIILTRSYGYSPSTWGFVYAFGAVLIIVFQLRVMNWVGGRSFVTRLTVGTLLMGVGFPLLILNQSLAVVLIVVSVFLAGDLIWGPASEYAPLRIAPPDRQGAYMGVLTSSIWLGSALAPTIALPFSARFGDNALWVLVFLIGALAAVIYRLTAAAASSAVPSASSQPEAEISS